MARRKSAGFKRDIGTDERYNSELVQKLINIVMWRGKKTVATTIVYEAMEMLTKKAGGDRQKGLEFFYKAFDQAIPVVEVRARRVGGSVYQVPTQVRPERARSLTFRWFISAAKARPNKTMGQRLGAELLAALEGQGGAVKKKIDMHKMADANRAFSHYAW